jgi:hypothetical protein
MNNTSSSKKIVLFVFLLFQFIFLSGLAYSYTHPVGNHYVTSPYGPRILSRGVHWHEGVDLRARNVPLHSIEAGDLYTIHTQPNASFGNYLVVSGTQNFMYCHLSTQWQQGTERYTFEQVRDENGVLRSVIIVRNINNNQITHIYRGSGESFLQGYIEEENTYYDVEVLPVEEGEIIALTGDTGTAAGQPHLHLNLNWTDNDNNENPLKIVPYTRRNSNQPAASIAYPTVPQGQNYYTPPAGATTIAFRAHIANRDDGDFNRIEFLIDRNNPPTTVVHDVSFDPRSNVQILALPQDPVTSNGCYPISQGVWDFGYIWNFSGLTGDYYVQIRAYDITDSERQRPHLSEVLHVRFGGNVVILQDTATLDGSAGEYEEQPWYNGCFLYAWKFKSWDVRYQTAQGCLVGDGLESITQITLSNAAANHVNANLYVNGALAPNGVWTRNPETEKIIPASWKVVFSPGPYSYGYGSNPVTLTAEAGGKHFARSLALFSLEFAFDMYDIPLWTGVYQSASSLPTRDCCGAYFVELYQENQILLQPGSYEIISIAGLPPAFYTITGEPTDCGGISHEREVVPPPSYNYNGYPHYWERNTNHLRCYKCRPESPNIPPSIPPPPYLPINIQAVVKPILSNEEKSILKDLGLPEQPQTVLSGSQ